MKKYFKISNTSLLFFSFKYKAAQGFPAILAQKFTKRQCVAHSVGLLSPSTGDIKKSSSSGQRGGGARLHPAPGNSVCSVCMFIAIKKI